jgi:crotonobetainyl-CoA:carnitine CoA-transferase CaiB-like acyl-CoA transferase
VQEAGIAVVERDGSEPMSEAGTAEAFGHAPPLAGLRVLDLTQVLSGPFCTQMLGDLGADVIKVEGPQGDIARSMPPHFVGADSTYYLAINRNKRSILVDMKVPEGLDVVRRLALASDIVIENFRPGVCERLGLSPVALRQQKPALIWCSISGFGQTGPYRDKPAYDITVQALSGGMSLTGERDGLAVRAGIPIADLSAGMFAATAVLAALHRRSVTGRGDYIDISMLDCQAAMLCYQAAGYLQSGQVPSRQGREHDSIATYRTFKARDGIELVIAALTERMWAALCRVLGCPELVDDPGFATATDRSQNRARLWPILEQRFLARTAAEWMEALDAAGVPVGIVNTVDRVVVDPQIVHRGMVTELASGDGRRARVMGNPMLLQEAGRRSHGFPPASGEHTRAVLEEVLGLGGDAIARLIDAGAVTAPERPPPRGETG